MDFCSGILYARINEVGVDIFERKTDCDVAQGKMQLMKFSIGKGS